MLNFVEDLQPILVEAARVIKAGGVLGFTVEEQKDGRSRAYVMAHDRIVEGSPGQEGVRMYRHSREYVSALLDKGGFVPLRELEFLASKYPQEIGGPSIFLKAHVARKVISGH